jgi:hypothetical protein
MEGCYADGAVSRCGPACRASLVRNRPSPFAMAQPVQYKKPRRINAVSITLVLVLLLGAYAMYQWLPVYFMRQEAYRVLQETGSKLAGRAAYYRQNTDEREALRRTMQRELIALGIDDPAIETWIELEGKEVRLGVVYSAWIEWPFDVVARHESVYEVEHVIVVP